MDTKGLFPAPWCSWLQVFLGTCPDVGDDIKPEDVPKEWIKEKLKELEGKPCDAVETSCKHLGQVAIWRELHVFFHAKY
ncbi:hypothetical protein VQ643_15875 [Pseudomonas sp. F1_0610]|uniref:hypothetical protein n=1 Tax=Pseudomonas sp. F1_0610 TaxID=3114284 RepID=UPI0039C49C8C